MKSSRDNNITNIDEIVHDWKETAQRSSWIQSHNQLSKYNPIHHVSLMFIIMLRAVIIRIW